MGETSNSNLKGSAAIVTVVDSFGDADPDVEQAEAGDDATDGAVVQEGGYSGMSEDESVAVPDARPPGEHHNEDAKVNTEEDEDEEGEALEPDGSGSDAPFRGCRRNARVVGVWVAEMRRLVVR